MMVSFVLSFFPRDVLDEILNLIESVSEDFPSYSCQLNKPWRAQGPVGVFHPLFQTALVRWLGSRHRRTSPTTGGCKHKCRDCHADGCENRCDGNFLLTKQGANALSQCGVLMEEPPECLTDSVDLGTEGCYVRGEGFEPCLSLKFDVREYTLELSDSVLNLSLHFSVVRFRQFLVLPGKVSFDLGFSVVDTRQLCQVVCQLISHFRHCLFEPSQLSSGLGDPHGVDWLIINRRQGALNLFCVLTCAVGYSGEVLEFDVFKVTREGFIRLLECFHSRATQTFTRVTGEFQRSPHCICTTHSVPRGQCCELLPSSY